MKMLMKTALVNGVALVLLASSLVAHANAQDTIADWSAIAETAVKTAAHPPSVAALDFAIVHLAIYDAVQSVEHRHHPYHRSIHHTSGSVKAAAAKAGHDVLVGLFPSQSDSLDTTYTNYLAENGIDPFDQATEAGAKAASNILQLRMNDGRFPANQVPFVGNDAIGQWRPTPSLLPGAPPSFAPGLTPWVANVTPFAMNSPSQFRVVPPPTFAGPVWTRDYNEIKDIGSLFSTTRTPEQTEVGYFWADSGPVMWQSALRDISRTYLHDIATTARMYALADVALADALIACWDSKYFYNFWRPITAIRLGDQDDNPRTDVDTDWQPLINTPNFPEYPSGHAATSGAIAHALRLFFDRDALKFHVTTTNPNAQQKTHTFLSFSQAEEDVVNARVYVGIHYRNTDNVSRIQGHKVANWTFEHFFRPSSEAKCKAQ